MMNLRTRIQRKRNANQAKQAKAGAVVREPAKRVVDALPAWLARAVQRNKELGLQC